MKSNMNPGQDKGLDSLHTKSSEPVSKKVIFIDMDGTSILQEVDHHVKYALSDAKSSLRTSLVDQLKWASTEQKNTHIQYDIVICTARPRITEPFLRLNIGTKPTKEVKALLLQSGCNVTDIIRTSVFCDNQLKGRILANYMRQHPEYTEGFLLDDQTKQKDIVEKMKLKNLKVFDVNSAEDMHDFAKIIGYSSAYSPENIIAFVINRFKLPARGSIDVSNEDKLHWLESQGYRSIPGTVKAPSSLSRHFSLFAHNAINFAEERNLVIKIIDDLALALYEACLGQYQPKIREIQARADFTRQLLILLGHHGYPPSKAIFDEKNNFESVVLAGKVPNSMCEKNIHQLLNQMISKAEHPIVTHKCINPCPARD